MDLILSKEEILRRLNTLRIQPLGLTPRNYGVSVKYFSNGKETPSKRIDYKTTVSLDLEHNKGTLSIIKKDILYNQHKADSISEILAESLSDSIYPIQTHINEKGLCTNEILNIKDIGERWDKTKSKISQKYASENLNLFFKEADHQIRNKISLENSLQYDWFWNLFFHTKFINYGHTRKTETDLFLSVVPYQFPIKFSGVQCIHKIPTEYHSFIIEFESTERPAHPYFIPKHLQNRASLMMSLKVIFDMDIYHHFPMHIRADFEIYSKDGKGNKISVKKIIYTQYHLNPEEFKGKTLSSNSPFLTGGLVSDPKNKRFYSDEFENDW